MNVHFTYFMAGAPVNGSSILVGATANHCDGQPERLKGTVIRKDRSLPWQRGEPVLAGDLVVTGGPGGWELWGSERTLRSVIARQRRTLLRAEATVLALLRGAHTRSAEEIRLAFRTIGAGTYCPESWLVRSLGEKGHVRLGSDCLYVTALSRKEVVRPITMPAKWQPAPDTDMWDTGMRPTSTNPLWHRPWWEAVDWPAHRGGRPPVRG
jgi:hypothetical protein